MPSIERFLSEEEYDQILQLNDQQGDLFAKDLYVLESYRSELAVKIERRLPRAVKPKLFPKLTLAQDSEPDTVKPLEGITALSHGKEVGYELVYDSSHQLREIRKYRGRGNYDFLTQADSHYHITQVSDGLRGESGYQPTRPLGPASTFIEAIEKLGQEAELYLKIASGELEIGKQPVYLGQFPPVDLGSSTYKAYLIGFSSALKRVGKAQHIDEVNQIIDSLPY